MKYLIIIFLSLTINSFSHSLDADYNGGEELQIIEKKPIAGYTKETYDRYDYPLTISTFSIYWNRTTTNYFFVEDGAGMIRTNGLTYKLDTNRLETSYTGEIVDPFLTFVGYISTNMRLYIDNRNTNQQYIKVLEPIQDTGYLEAPLVPNKTTSASSLIYSPNGLTTGRGRHYERKGAIHWVSTDEIIYSQGPTYTNQ